MLLFMFTPAETGSGAIDLDAMAYGIQHRTSHMGDGLLFQLQGTLYWETLQDTPSNHQLRPESAGVIGGGISHRLGEMCFAPSRNRPDQQSRFSEIPERESIPSCVIPYSQG